MIEKKIMCTNLVHKFGFPIFAEIKEKVMLIVSSREFRANQRKYFELAQTGNVIIKSRNYGSFRLIPVKEDDFVLDQAELDSKIKRGIADYENGKVYKMKDGESSAAFLERMIREA